MQEDTTAVILAELGFQLKFDMELSCTSPDSEKCKLQQRTQVLHQVQTEEGTGDLVREHQETCISMGVDQWNTEIRALTLVQISFCEQLLQDC